jgi:hypothetical protein
VPNIPDTARPIPAVAMPPKNPETPPFHQASMLLLVRLPAYAANRTRRLIKSPKLHQGATGVAHLWMLAES